jgi:hypothetical protein
MHFTIRTTDVPDDSIRKAIVDPLIAYNQMQTGRSMKKALIS